MIGYYKKEVYIHGEYYSAFTKQGTARQLTVFQSKTSKNSFIKKETKEVPKEVTPITEQEFELALEKAISI